MSETIPRDLKEWAERWNRVAADFCAVARRWSDIEGPKIIVALDEFSRAAARVKWPRERP